MVPGDGPATIEGCDSISALSIAGHLKRDEIGFGRLGSVCLFRQQGCRRGKCRKSKKLAAVQSCVKDHVCQFL